jgi:hypothetical protein
MQQENKEVKILMYENSIQDHKDFWINTIYNITDVNITISSDSSFIGWNRSNILTDGMKLIYSQE